MIKPLQPSCGRGNAIPLWWLAPPPCPVGSMSLDSRVAGLPYESSSFATPAVRWGGKRKAPLNFSFPLEGKCHVVAKGCTRVSIPMKLTIVLLGPTSADLETLCRVSTKRRILVRTVRRGNATKYQSAGSVLQVLGPCMNSYGFIFATHRDSSLRSE